MPYVPWCNMDCGDNDNDDDDDESKTYMQYCTVCFNCIYNNNSAESPNFYFSVRCSKGVKLEK